MHDPTHLGLTVKHFKALHNRITTIDVHVRKEECVTVMMTQCHIYAFQYHINTSAERNKNEFLKVEEARLELSNPLIKAHPSAACVHMSVHEFRQNQLNTHQCCRYLKPSAYTSGLKKR